MKKQGSMTPPEEHSSSLEIDPDFNEIYKIPGKELK